MFQILKSSTSGFYDEPVKYVTKLDFPMLLVIIIGILIILFISLIISANWILYKKANKSGISSIIPIYNVIVLLQIISLPAWQLIMFLIPLVNIYFIIMIPFKLAKAFGKDNRFGFGLLFFPLIFLPMLAFSKAEYLGINMEANTIILNDYKNDEVDTRVVDENSLSSDGVGQGVRRNVNVSTGSSFVSYNANATINVRGENNMENNNEQYASFRVNNNTEPSVVPSVSPTVSPIVTPSVDVPVSIPTPEVVQNTVVEQPVIREEMKVVPVVNSNFTILDPVEVPMKKEVEEPQSTYINLQSSHKPVVSEEKDEDSSKLSFIAPIDILPPEEKRVEKVVVEEKVLGIPSTGMQDVGDSQFVTCPKCGTKIKRGAARCFICGTPLQ